MTKELRDGRKIVLKAGAAFDPDDGKLTPLVILETPQGDEYAIELDRAYSIWKAFSTSIEASLWSASIYVHFREQGWSMEDAAQIASEISSVKVTLTEETVKSAGYPIGHTPHWEEGMEQYENKLSD